MNKFQKRMKEAFDKLEAITKKAGAEKRSLTDDELRLGLDFVSTVLEVASGSARAMAAVLAERSPGPVH